MKWFNLPKVFEKSQYFAGAINSKFDVHFKLIFLFSFLFQGFILFSNSYFEDSTLIIREFESGHFVYFKEKLILDGLPLIAYFHQFIGSFQCYIFLYKVIGFLAFFISYYFFFKLIQVFNWLTTFDSFLLATITMLIPNYFNWYEPIYTPYSICFSIFIFSCFWYLRYYDSPNLYLSIVGGISFFLSFSLGSLLFYTYGFLFILFIWKYKKDCSFVNNSITFARKNWLIIMLPILFRSFFVLFFPAQDDYNTVNLTLKGFAYRFPKSLYNIVIYPFDKLKEFFLADNSTIFIVIGGAIFIMIVWFYFSRTFIKEEKRTYSRKTNYFVIAAGFLLLFCAIFPFVAVRKLGDYRNPLLLIPLGLILFSCFFIIGNRIARYLLFLCIFLMLLLVNYTHIAVQTKFLKRVSVIENLKNCRNLHDIVVFEGWGKGTVFYEWNYMLKKAFPKSEYFTFNAQETFYYQDLQSLKELTDYEPLYLMPKKVPKNDSISIITLKENKKYNEIKILFNYLFCKENLQEIKEYVNCKQKNRKNTMK